MSKKSPFTPLKRTQVEIPWQDVTAALVRTAGLTEGYWKIGFSFGMQALNVNIGPAHLPAAMAFIERVVLTRVEALDLLSVDAAQVNPSSRIILPVGAGVN